MMADPSSSKMAETEAEAAASTSSNTAAGPSSSSSATPPTCHLVYAKSRVTLHPTPYSKDNIPGYLCLLRQEGGTATATTTSAASSSPTTLLAWLPEELVADRSETAKFVDVELREAEGAEERGEAPATTAMSAAASSAPSSAGSPSRPRSTIHTTEISDSESVLVQPPPREALYAFAHPLTELYSIRLLAPSISNWHGSLVVSLRGGETLAPLYFHDDESRRTILGVIRAGRKDGRGGGNHAAAAGSAASPGSSGYSSGNNYAYPPPHPHARPPAWGGDELVQHLRKYAHVHRSVHDHGVFLLNPTPADLEVHSTPTFADDAVDERAAANLAADDVAFPDDPFAPTYPLRMGMGSARGNGHGTGALPPGSTPQEALGAWARTTRMSLLSSFSQVTRSARDASRQILSHPAGRPYTSRLPAAVQSFAHAGPLGPFAPVTADEDPSKISQRAGVAEYDSARVYLAKWARLVAEEGERNRRRRVQAGSEGDDTTQHEHGGLGVFELIGGSAGDKDDRSSASSSTTTTRKYDPIRLEEWNEWLAPASTLPLDELQDRVWQRGLAPSARHVAWPVLLGVVDNYAASTAETWHEWHRVYTALQRAASTIETRDDVVEQRHRIRVDCLRIDRRLPFFKDQPRQRGDGGEDTGGDTSTAPASAVDHISRLADVLLAFTIHDAYGADPTPATLSSSAITSTPLGGYVQGMSDLCAPLYVVCEGDASKTLACFIALMRRVRTNFFANQSGMKTQLLQLQALIRLVDPPLYAHLEQTDSLNLFFCFRWLLVRFKREFDFEDVCRLWECGWAAGDSGGGGDDKVDSGDSGEAVAAAAAAATTETETQVAQNTNVGGDTAADNNATADTSRLIATTAPAAAAATAADANSLAPVTTTTTAAAAVDADADASAAARHRRQRQRRPHTAHLHVFTALHILLSNRQQTMTYLSCFDEVLQYFQGLGGSIDVEDCIVGAERLVRAVARWVNKQREGREGRVEESGGGDGDDAFETIRRLVIT